MLLKRRPPGISSSAPAPLAGFEHLDPKAIAVLRWLNANKVDFVLVGPVARAIRGEVETVGPAAIVPAPYGRNWERLCTALTAGRAGLRTETAGRGGAATPAAAALKLTADKLARGRRWLLRCGSHDLDIEGLAVPDSAGSAPCRSGYQELLYEAGSYAIAEEVSVQVAAPEDLELYSHARRTGSAPEFRVTRTAQTERETA
jgi:hypothetical protein